MRWVSVSPLLSPFLDSLFRSIDTSCIHIATNQAKMFLDETTTRDYANDTLDPVAGATHIVSFPFFFFVLILEV